jgi:hypothetical protein
MRLTAVFLVSALMGGCSNLILRDDDTTAETVGKVTTRAILILPTFFVSEAYIAKVKREEARQAKRAEQTVYFSAVCEKEGFINGTSDHTGCVSAKLDQSEPVQVNTGVITTQPRQQLLNTYCRTSSSGRSTICY